MSFNINELLGFCILEIRRFAKDHQHEVFYGFAFDGGLLCLNSEEEFARLLKRAQDDWDRKMRPIYRWEELTKSDLWESDYLLGLHERTARLDRNDKKACLAVINENRSWHRAKGNPYRDPAGIQALRANTGDWAYQGFAEMAGVVGFDDNAYDEHYSMSDEEQKTSAYGIAMDTLVERLLTSGVFAELKTVPGFYATRVEHNY